MDPKEVKLAIGMAVSDTIAYETVGALMGMFSVTRVKQLVFMMEAGCYVHHNRSKILNKAVAQDCTHLFFLDADMVCPPDTIMRLLAADKPVIGVHYNKRQHPPQTTVKMADLEGKAVGFYQKELPNEVFQCFAVGTGCMLIDLSVLNKIEKPYFDLITDEDGLVTCSEDVWFCRKANRAGIGVWCDPTFKVGHIGDYAY